MDEKEENNVFRVVTHIRALGQLFPETDHCNL